MRRLLILGALFLVTGCTKRIPKDRVYWVFDKSDQDFIDKGKDAVKEIKNIGESK